MYYFANRDLKKFLLKYSLTSFALNLGQLSFTKSYTELVMILRHRYLTQYQIHTV